MLNYKVWFFFDCLKHTFMSRGAFLEHICMDVCGYDCLEHIYWWVWAGGFDFFGYFYGCVWVGVTV